MPKNGNVTRPRTEPTLITSPSPWRRSAGSTARVTRCSPMTFTSNSSRTCPAVKASLTPAAARPALLTTTSIRPAVLRMASTARSTEASFVTSRSSGVIARFSVDASPRRATAFTRFLPSVSRIDAKTEWPARARVSAVSRPNPVEAPVTRTIFLLMMDLPCPMWVPSHRCGSVPLTDEEIADGGRDVIAMRFQREMAGVEELHLDLRIVPLERLGAGRKEEGVVLAPDRQDRWALGAEVLLELRVQRDVTRVVQEQIELDFVVTGPSKQRRVERIALGRDQRCVRHAVQILPLGCLGLEKVAERRPVLGRGLLPVALDRVPALTEPLLIRVAVLRDDRSDPLRMARRETEADRRTVVENVNGIAGEPDNRREPVDDVGEAIEGVPELRPVRSVGESEARQVGSHHVVVIRQARNQVAEHVGGRRESVKQQQRGRRAGACFSAEDVQAIHIDKAISCPTQFVRQRELHDCLLRLLGA